MIAEFWTNIKRGISGLTAHPHWQELTINSIVNGLEYMEQAQLSIALEAQVGREKSSVIAEAELSLQANGKVKLILNSINHNGSKIGDLEFENKHLCPE